MGPQLGTYDAERRQYPEQAAVVFPTWYLDVYIYLQLALYTRNIFKIFIKVQNGSPMSS